MAPAFRLDCSRLLASAARCAAGSILSLAALGAAAAETTRFVLLSGDGKPGGEQVVERGDDGWTTVRFRYKNNGRGPEFTERFRLTANGTPERFYLPAERVASLDLDSLAVRDFIALLKARQTVIDPTLTTFDFIKQRDGETAEPYRAIVSHMPPAVQRHFKVGTMKMADDATAARYRASYARMVAFVGRLHRAGVPLVAGTDAIPGFTLHSELEPARQPSRAHSCAPARLLQTARCRAWRRPL